MVDQNQVIKIAQNLLDLLALSYNYSKKELPTVINNFLTELPRRENWRLGK
ncbi:hypothetical protein [Dapis sp. BLCC M229]|uniref:hypothetical protein n=1 Tax=Dapis sp. BLCC M229 TaxID=3400188 RepID=UPI003CECF6D7